MDYFEKIGQSGPESVVFCVDAKTGLRAFISIDNTKLGPALGGCRMKAYTSEEAALDDVLRLSKAMTYKNALAGLNKGGGKTVVILDRLEDKTPELLDALARRIEALKGTYIGAGDIGSTTADLARMKKTTRWVGGLSQEDGGLGDSAVLTAYGVFRGIQASVKEQLGQDDLAGLKVAVQGAGKVGFNLMKNLLNAGCQVWATDLYDPTLEHLRAELPQVTIVAPEALLALPVDIFSPNAVGGSVTPEVAQMLKVSIVAGGANNVLSDVEAGEILKSRSILFAPDFAINSGGVIVISAEVDGLTLQEAQRNTEAVYERTLAVFAEARKENIQPYEAARRLALRRIETQSNIV